MVKRNLKSSVSEDDDESQIINKNGKRPSNEPKKGEKKRLKIKSLYRQPTVNELNRLQETETLFNSNLFRLQVEEVLQEVKVKEKTEKRFLQWFEGFRKHLDSIPTDDNEYDLTEQTLTKKLKVKLPIGAELAKTKCVFKFIKFKQVEVVGSYALECAINSKLKVDIQIVVPAETYTKNDSINYRYHKKKAAYLAYIASHINKLDTIEDVQYSFKNGSETAPILEFKPKGKLGNSLTVCINLICEPEAYKFHRFSPSRNNLREAWLFSLENPDNSNEVGPPTPYYNNSILSDLTALENLQFLTETLKNSDNLKQAVTLLKIWLRQRNLNVSGHVISLYVAYLVQNKRINNIMSSYQIVRNVWIALKSSELDTKGISLNKNQDAALLEEYNQHFPVVFLDKTGHYNICWQMCQGTYNALRRECVLAVEMLDNSNINSFIPLFMTKVELLTQFDHILRFKDLSIVKEKVLSKCPKEDQVNYGLDQLALIRDTIYKLLTKGLGNRVDLLLPMLDVDLSWSIKKTLEKAKSDGYQEKMLFGLIMNPENYLNTVDKGPSANLPEAEEFRAFWGSKSELRRFQDGSITEACVWSADTMLQRRALTGNIIDYLLDHKYGISSSQVYHVSEQLDSLLSGKCGGDDVEEAALAALRAFDDLRRDLRDLTQLPLDISAVYGTSPVFSYSCPSPPLVSAAPHNPWRRGHAALVKHVQRPADNSPAVPPHVAVCRAVMELGYSGKWPGDLQAFRCLKAAFHLQISERLNKQFSLATHAYPTHVDVLKGGLVFRLEIAHPKEITLLKREIENGVVKHRDSDESARLERDTVLLPRVRGALHGLHQKYPAYGPATCLFKRWLSCHLLLEQVTESAAELLTAAVFVRPEPLAPPAGTLPALLRVLALLAHTNWHKEMLVLDFNGDMTREEILEVEQQYAALDPRPALHIVTSQERGGLLTRDVTAAGLSRARQLAAAALPYCRRALLHDHEEHLLAAFVPSLSGYDVTLHLNPGALPRRSAGALNARVTSRAAPQSPASGDVIPAVEFNPVTRYLQELRSAYGEWAVFFYDVYGGDVIAVLWRPHVRDVRHEFQITEAAGLTPASPAAHRLNVEAVVRDFQLLGAGLVSHVTLHT